MIADGRYSQANIGEMFYLDWVQNERRMLEMLMNNRARLLCTWRCCAPAAALRCAMNARHQLPQIAWLHPQPPEMVKLDREMAQQPKLSCMVMSQHCERAWR